MLVRRGWQTRFCGVAFKAQDEIDVLRLADRTNSPRGLPSRSAGERQLTDPSGTPVKVVAGMHELPKLSGQQPHLFNFGHDLRRTNGTQRPPRQAPRSSGSARGAQSTRYIGR